MNEHDAERDATPSRRTVLRGAVATGLATGGLALTDRASAQSERELVVRAASGARVRYTIQVSGTIEPGEGADYSDAVLNGTVAKGQTADGEADSFTFTGELNTVRLDGPGKVLVDGELVKDTTEDLPNEITVEGAGEGVQYAFQVSGRVEKGEGANSADEIVDSNTVRGVVGGGTDRYRFSGDISFDDPDGPLTVTLEFDGEE